MIFQRLRNEMFEWLKALTLLAILVLYYLCFDYFLKGIYNQNIQISLIAFQVIIVVLYFAFVASISIIAITGKLGDTDDVEVGQLERTYMKVNKWLITLTLVWISSLTITYLNFCDSHELRYLIPLILIPPFILLIISRWRKGMNIEELKTQ